MENMSSRAYHAGEWSLIGLFWSIMWTSAHSGVQIIDQNCPNKTRWIYYSKEGEVMVDGVCVQEYWR